jgi:uncharacterized membrane protein YhaH (DUF805 family)/osmotically-inducible protein OsmY
MNDPQLRRDVIDQRNAEPSVDGAHIGVAAKKGVATPSGHVGGYVEKTTAVAAARRVDGGRAIGTVNRMRYDFYSFLARWTEDRKPADEVIAQRAIDVLQSDPLVSDNNIQVAVSDGLITLSGATDWNYQKQAAEEDVRNVTGVTGVIDNIKVVNKSFLQAIASGFLNYANFSGRASQSEYWFWVLFATLGMVVTWTLDAAFVVRVSEKPLFGEFVSGISPFYSPINFVFIVALLLPSLAIATRRLHDVDRTGWWMLLSFTGLGIVLLLYWKCKKGHIRFQ